MSNSERFKKIIRLGTSETKQEVNRLVKAVVYGIYCQITWDGRRLSITGVEGPRLDGDCYGSSGQIVMHRPMPETFADGWSAEQVNKFYDMWDRWHRNDMRAGCEHQRASWPKGEQVTLVTYQLTTEALREQNRLKDQAMKSLKDTGHAVIQADQQHLLNLKWQITLPEGQALPVDLAEFYQEKKRETKNTTSLRPDEHPKGLLCKPCEVCGYKWGSSWLHEDVPQDVIDYFRGLPDSPRTPAWI